MFKFQRLMRQVGKRRVVSRRQRAKVLRAEPLETRQLLAADAIASVVSPIDPAGMASSNQTLSAISPLAASTGLASGGTTEENSTALSAVDFQYLGATKTTVGTGFEFGLAYRPETNTFFTIGNAGRAPYDLLELSVPTGGGKATLVKNWGPIDPTGRLNVPGVMVRMEGLNWDDGKLWVSWGSYYNADHSNDECLAYVTFGGGTLHLHGPWGVPGSVGSDNLRGLIATAPAELTAITGQPFISFVGKANTDQDASWGPNLVSFANPAQSPVKGQTTAEELTHWPMLDQRFIDPVSGRTINNYHSAFPRLAGDKVERISGNENVNPPLKLTYQNNVLTPEHTYIAGDGVYAGAWIKEGALDGLVYFGRVSLGSSWYGNYNAHDDESSQGVSMGNDMSSIEHPGQPLIDTAVQTRGNHADAWAWRVYFVSAADVLNTASKVQTGTATAADLQEGPTSIVKFSTLGGNVPPPPPAAGFSGSYFNAVTGVFYLLEPNGEMLEWRIAAPMAAPTPAPLATLTVSTNLHLSATLPVLGTLTVEGNVNGSLILSAGVPSPDDPATTGQGTALGEADNNSAPLSSATGSALTNDLARGATLRAAAVDLVMAAEGETLESEN
jgi:hypothetical protein